MDKPTLRKQLLANATAMCQYAERELNGVARVFEMIYERGFIYHHSNCDYIRFAYYPKSKKAEIEMCHYGSSMSVENGKIYHHSSYNDNEDYTNTFLTNMVGCNAEEVEQALTITQGKWQAIKQRIAEHKQEEDSIMNFEL